MLTNWLKLTFAKALYPPNIEFSDVSYHDLSIGGIQTGIIDSLYKQHELQELHLGDGDLQVRRWGSNESIQCADFERPC